MSFNETGNLFEEPQDETEIAFDINAPLAERMRPREIEEFAGQQHLVGEGRFLRRLIEGKSALPSLIFWGAPGTGKTTLARLLSKHSDSYFVALSAVFSGVKELRAAISEAKERKRKGKRTLLFIDEIHRFNKAQQDALLPAVENGTVTLIGATTENPSFEVNAAVLSRTRVLTLNPLEAEDIFAVLKRAIEDETRGVASLNPKINDDVLMKLAASSGGDARVALAALESATISIEPNEKGERIISEEIIIESVGRARFAYDKGGEDHYNIISAMIKSIRNSDVNAALYWLARLIEGGADPMFIARRLCILASEDVGLADPNAITQAAAAAQITHLIGFPEALYPLSQAAIYLARAPKSNAVKRAYHAALEDASRTSGEPVPLHLRNAITPLMKHIGYGKDYRYVHDDRAAKEEMECLPEKLKGHVYFDEKE